MTILQGNHDYLRAGHAYFEFLNHIPGVRFVTQPYEDTLGGAGRTEPNVLWLPHTKTPAKDWEGFDFEWFDYVFMHQTVEGSVTSNGQKMEGREALPSMKGCKVYSGDIHVPQVIGEVEYVGSPYHVHFGDNFKPRVVLLDSRGRAVDLHMESARRQAVTVSSLRELQRLEFRKGDHVKLRLELDVADKHEWSKIRRQAMEYLKGEEVELHGLDLRVAGATTALEVADTADAVKMTDEELVERFVVAHDLGGDVLDQGLRIIE